MASEAERAHALAAAEAGAQSSQAQLAQLSEEHAGLQARAAELTASLEQAQCDLLAARAAAEDAKGKSAEELEAARTGHALEIADLRTTMTTDLEAADHRGQEALFALRQAHAQELDAAGARVADAEAALAEAQAAAATQVAASAALHTELRAKGQELALAEQDRATLTGQLASEQEQAAGAAVAHAHTEARLLEAQDKSKIAATAMEARLVAAQAAFQGVQEALLLWQQQPRIQPPPAALTTPSTAGPSVAGRERIPKFSGPGVQAEAASVAGSKRPRPIADAAATAATIGGKRQRAVRPGARVQEEKKPWSNAQGR
jgi:hypothetical protein